MHLCAVDLPIEPLATCHWHKRPLDAIRLVAAGQLALPDWSTLTDVAREWAPPAPNAARFVVRPFEERDVGALTREMRAYLDRFEIGAVMGEAEVRHRFMPRAAGDCVDDAEEHPRVVHTFVVLDVAAAVATSASASGAATTRGAEPPQPALLGAFSFYELSDRAAKGGTPVRAAMAFYNAPFDATGRLSAVRFFYVPLHFTRIMLTV